MKPEKLGMQGIRSSSSLHPLRVATVIVSLALPAGCAARGASYQYLGIRAEHAADGTPVSGAAADYCLVMPVLPGSRVDKRIGVEGPLAISLSATNDQVVLRFEGATDDRKLTVWAEDLAAEWSRTVEISNSAGTRFAVTLSSACR
jgi:hypothetical protein